MESLFGFLLTETPFPYPVKKLTLICKVAKGASQQECLIIIIIIIPVATTNNGPA